MYPIVNCLEHNLNANTLNLLKRIVEKKEVEFQFINLEHKNFRVSNEVIFLIQINATYDFQIINVLLTHNLKVMGLLSNISLLREALSLDLAALILNPVNEEELYKAINKCVKGEHKEKARVNTNLPLTDREFDILSLLSNGYLYKEIAYQKGITLGTVKQHLHRIYHKLHVNNKVEAINLMQVYQ